MSRFKDKLNKLTESMDKLPGRLDRFKESVAYAVNPDHRHDESHEKEIDNALAAIRDEHPYNSFAGPRDGNLVKFYDCGHDYFYALSELLDNAKETIWILDWWLSPELYLRRPGAKHEEWRLDRLLKRKAEEGVKVYVMVYKEVTQSMTMSSAHTKHFLEDLHENISVMRHPDHLGGEVTLYWSHHEKVCVVDNTFATIGGLDLCFGRWDTRTHPLSDVHPTDFARVLFPGQDYNNARVQDFQAVDHWVSNQQSRLETARMPWQDVHSMIQGPVVFDIAQHFVERWNFVKHLKYKHSHRFPALAFPHVVNPDERPQPAIARHPRFEKFAEIGAHFFTHKQEPPAGHPTREGTVNMQVVRSSADWSHGILTEHSIQNAYRQVILEANHCIYIENQFFITTTGAKKSPVQNKIGLALVERIVSAAKSQKRFQVIIIIPAVPGFAGDIQAKGSSGTLAILGAQLKSIEDIFEQIRAAGVNPDEYISFYNLRSYDRINHDSDRIKRMEERSGVTWYQAQAALARLQLGRDASEDELRKNKEVLIAVPQRGGEQAAISDEARTKEQVAANEIKLPLPDTYEEAEQIVRRFEQADHPDEKISDSVAHHAQKGTGSLFDEKWVGSEESERNAFVTEELYIHSKLLIADDRVVILGSANINDRSMLGSNDSEIACIYRDRDQIESRMDGKPYLAARFAANLRRELFKNHLGLAPPQFCPAGDVEPVTPAMRMVGTPNVDEIGSPEDEIVLDPLSPELEALWKGNAQRNSEAFANVFRCVPAAGITTWKEYKDYVPKSKVGHVARADMPVQYIKEQLDQVRGHLVNMPLDFLSKEQLLATDASVNPITLSHSFNFAESRYPTMDRFRRLHTYLETILANPPPPQDSQAVSKLQVKLERARPAFLELLDTPGKNQAQRQQLEKGSFTYVATGSSYPAGPALVKDILALSDALDLSEELAASLVAYGINAKPRAGLGRAESGLLVHLDERTSLVLCLQAIWRGALSADERLAASGIQRVFEREAEELTHSRSGQDKDAGNWVEKIINALDANQQSADKLRTQLRQPVASQSALVPAGQPSSSSSPFSDETTQLRIYRLEEERRLIAQLLFLIGASRTLSPDAIQLLVRQLQTATQNDSAAIYLLAALLAALDTSDEAAAEQLYPLFTNKAFVQRVKSDLSSSWTIPHLKAVTQLQWSIFLESASRYVADFDTAGGDSIDQLTWQAVDAGVFSFLGRVVLAHKWEDNELAERWGAIGAELQPLGGPDASVEPWFQDYVTEQVEILVVEVITNRISILRKLRNREEDVVSTSHRGGGLRSSRSGNQSEQARQPRHDLEAFFLLVSAIYRNSPDAGLKFWEETAIASESSSAVEPNPINSRLSAFLRWGAECKPAGMMRAYYEMLASLASGPRSATYAFGFLSSGDANSRQQASSTCSWSALFGALEFYLNNLPDRPMDFATHHEGMLGEIPPEEIPLLRSFIHLLEQVVLYSDVARATLYDNQRHRPIATLFALTGRSVPIDLKASLIGAINAFSRPGGSFGVEVARRTWAALEQSQILPTWTVSDPRVLGTSSGFGMSMRVPEPSAIDGGIMTELEEVEAPNKVYPESTAFVSLLNTLVHAPRSSPLASSLSPSLATALQRGSDLDSNTIPDTLGAPNRAPGVEPYIKFVIDDVLLKTGQREYQDPRERWKITDKCLEFVEKTLASFDLGPFLAWAAAGGRNTDGAQLAQVTLHPGFDTLTRILSGSPLLITILTIVTAGLDSVANNVAGTPLFASCMLRCLRIIRRTFQIQAPFLEVFLPALSESSVSLTPEKLARLKSLQPIDQSFLYHSEVVVQIALLVACDEQEEIALLAVQILALVADSPFFDVQQKFPDQSRSKLNRLVGLLQASPETLRIQEAFVQRLDEDVPESELDSPSIEESAGGEEDPSALRRAIRSSILDFFLANTRTDRSAPNLAHLLLGFDAKGRPESMEIEDPAASETRRTSLHVVLELLTQNVSDDETEASISLLARHPTLASKSYLLIRQLCLHPYTSAVLSRYLRNREQFFLTQSSKLPFPVPSASEGPLGSLQYSDNTQITTSSSAVCAILQSQAWLLDSTALELSVLTSGNDVRRAQELVAGLFEAGTQDPSIAYENGGGVAQTLPRMLEIFHSFDFAWIDSITPIEHRLHLFAELHFDSCLKLDSTGCEVYDFAALLALIGAAKRELQNRGMLNSAAQQEEAKLETRAIVETLVVENHRREIQSARYLALRSWRNLLDIVLAKSFRFLPSEGVQSLLLDLMTAILPPLAAQEMDAAISELLSGAAVLLSTKLRDEGIDILYVESGEAIQSVSPERLHSILRLVLQAILQPGVSPIVRGNLYTVLLNYIQYSTKVAALSPALAKNLADVDVDSASVASFNDDLLSLDGLSTVGGTRRSGAKKNALETGNLTIFASALDRLLPIICRDAAAGHEVWRTVAFTALDAIVAVAEEGKALSKVLAILSKQGYLSSFVNAFKDMEADLQDALQPDPESLNALYVYEALVSFLIRLSSSREGAEKLLQAELLSRLASCQYLETRPVAESSSTDFDGFLPATTERHHQLLLPALQLVVGTLVSFGPETTVASRQAHAFVAGQRENLLIALKDCAATQNVALMREAHLIVTLLTIVSGSVSDEELTTFSSFGGLHSALVGLSAKICGPQEWTAQIAPSSDSEREEDQTLVLALRDNGTIFTDKVDTLVESLQTALLTYQSSATTKRAGSTTFRPVLLPSTRVGENAVAGQNLGSAMAFLRDTTQALEDRLNDAKTLADMVENFDTRPLDEIEEVFEFPRDDGSDNSDRRGRILQELQTLQRKYRLQVASSLHLLELALLLLWRHVAFYLDPERVDSSRPDVGLGLADTLKARSNQINLSSFDVPTLRENLAYEFRRLSERLNGLELSQQSAGSNWRQRESYIGVVVRRLGELLSPEREA
ncbi:uncharacterized protein JCM15063_003177 [Sporobolomyces koalae]|uniref:uncharacterized protein n=1 Tax=Sporobolomyces koalae TaxID=500713 RepID=UPI00318012B0